MFEGMRIGEFRSIYESLKRGLERIANESKGLTTVHDARSYLEALEEAHKDLNNIPDNSRLLVYGHMTIVAGGVSFREMQKFIEDN